MIEVVLVVICAIGLYTAWSIVKYNKKVKEQVRDNQRRASSPKKRKYKSAKKKAIESKVKKNAGRNKKKV